MAALTGMEMAMPTAPPRLEPTTMARSDRAGCTWTAERMTTGLTTLSVTFSATMATTRVQKAHTGLTNRAVTVAMAALIQGPTTGTKWSSPVRMPMSGA